MEKYLFFFLFCILSTIALFKGETIRYDNEKTIVRNKRYTAEEQEAFDFLQKYGYIQSNAVEDSDLETALIKFQEKYYLFVDGTYNEATKKLMTAPRCTRGDILSNFQVKATKWNKTELVWYFPNAPEEAINIARKAFEIWSNATVLRFQQTIHPTTLKPDIELSFVSRDHNVLANCMGTTKCNFPFDGPGKVLAHSYFPAPDGSCVDIHFDSAEEWTFSDDINSEKVSFLNVLTHELGHALGLEHSSVESAIMFPWYHNVSTLDVDDIRGIEVLYGNQFDAFIPPTTISTSPPLNHSDEDKTPSDIRSLNNLCEIIPHFIFLANGPRFPMYRVYIGYYNSLWKLDVSTTVAPSKPDRLTSFTRGTELARLRIHHIFQYFEDDLIIISGYNKYIVSFPQLRVKFQASLFNLRGYHINAAFQSHSGKMYIFYNYDSYIEYGITPFTNETGRGRINEIFPGLPFREIRYGFKWVDGHLYFLTNYYFYKYNEFFKVVVESGPFKWSMFNIHCPDDQLLYQVKTALTKLLQIYQP